MNPPPKFCFPMHVDARGHIQVECAPVGLIPAIGPVASMLAIEKVELTRAAREVRKRLGRVIKTLGAVVESE